MNRVERRATIAICARILIPCFVASILSAFASVPSAADECLEQYCNTGPTFCTRCYTYFQPLIELEPLEDSREFFDGSFGYTNYPKGWAWHCIRYTQTEPYEISLAFRYVNTYAGAKFAVFVDGWLIGTTGTSGSGWGAPDRGVQGELIGTFTFFSCPGVHLIEFREITMESRTCRQARDVAMATGGVRIALTATRVTTPYAACGPECD